MEENMNCKYCFEDLSDAKFLTVCGTPTNTNYMCQKCAVMKTIVTESVREIIEERFLYCLSVISSRYKN
jgi:hypothetical protein